LCRNKQPRTLGVLVIKVIGALFKRLITHTVDNAWAASVRNGMGLPKIQVTFLEPFCTLTCDRTQKGKKFWWYAEMISKDSTYLLLLWYCYKIDRIFTFSDSLSGIYSG
jgi:hypothetical protein